MLGLWGPPLASAVVAWLALSWMLEYGRRFLPIDHPNARSLHGVPIPRTGGVAILAGALPALAWLGGDYARLAAVAAGLGLVSLVDDFRNLPAGLRLVAHLAAAAIAVGLVAPAASWAILGLACLALAWMTNLYNFMDGSDGLAGGMTVIGFGAYAVASLWDGAGQQPSAYLCIAAAGVAFLSFNFHPARVFMGDSGSVPIGFLAAALGLRGVRDGAWPWWYPVLVFSPFVVDATVTLVRRGMRGERVWQAHRSHYYQRLVRSGLGHRGTALAEYALMLACAASGLAALHASAAVQAAVLIGWVVAYVAIARAVDGRWARHEAGGDAR